MLENSPGAVCVQCAASQTLSTVCGAAVMTSYEKNFPLKALAPVFAKIEAARKEAEKARDAAKRAKILAEKAAEKAAAAAAKAGEASPDAKMAESVPQPGKRCFTARP